MMLDTSQPHVRTLERCLKKSELVALCVFLFVLPIWEAPKNFALYIFIALWFVNSSVERNWGPREYAYEIPLAFISATSLIPFYFLNGKNINNTVDFISIAILLMIVARTTMPMRSILVMSGWCLMGAIAGIFEGMIRGGTFPSLLSVGHINQTAQYLAILFVIPLTCLLVPQKKYTLIGVILGATLGFLVISTNSRNALYGCLGVILLSPLILVMTQHYKIAVKAFAVAILVILSVVIFKPGAILKQSQQTAENHSLFDDGRKQIYKAVILLVSDIPTFGSGAGRFGAFVSPENIDTVLSKKGEVFRPGDYYFTDHGHSFILTWVIERGFLNLVVFLGWWIYLFYYLIKALSSQKSQQQSLIFAGIITLVLIMLLGIGNTSFHHEHGMLSAVIIAAAVSVSRRANQPRRFQRPSLD